MKAEHRRELKTNTLAESLTRGIHSLKEGPSRGTLVVAGVAVVVVVLVLLWRYFASSAREGDSARWLQWDTLFAPSQLDEFADRKDIARTTQARLARFQQARLQLHEGMRLLGSATTRAEGLDRVGKAAKTYAQLADESSPLPLLHQEALLGAGKANESLRDYDQATKFYNELVSKYPTTALGKRAAEDLKRLNDEANRKDLEQLARDLAPASHGR